MLEPEKFDPYDLSNIPEGHTRYLIEDDKGEFTLDVPSTWKVTYGKLHAGARMEYGRENGNVLRLYETKEKQRAVFLNVVRFRDMSLQMCRDPGAILQQNAVRYEEPEVAYGWQ